MPSLVYTAPFRSVAAALVLAIFFGPIGLFYSSFIGGVIMCVLAMAGVGTVAAMNSILPMVTVWLLSIVWAMISVRYYNSKLLKKLMAHEFTATSDADNKKPSNKKSSKKNFSKKKNIKPNKESLENEISDPSPENISVNKLKQNNTQEVDAGASWKL